jgi:pimeloyl-ACP methyl ester carboxylesterase
MSETIVLVHGAWQSGAHFEEVAAHLRGAGHTVHCPTLRGNRPEDDRSRISLEDAAASLVEYIEGENLTRVRLVAHSYGGMVISAAAERLLGRLQRLVYLNAFVPLEGQNLLDLAPPAQQDLLRALGADNHGAVLIPFPIWREAFVGNADLDRAHETYATLNAQPIATFTDPVVLTRPLAELEVGKSYINCRQDTAMPHSLPWHPRLSERLGLFRLVELDGDHQMMMTGPEELAAAILKACAD